MDAESLADAVVSAIPERTKLDPRVVEDCIFGYCYPSGEAPAIVRTRRAA